MDRKMIMDYLAQAERHVSQGAAHIEQQRELVKQLMRDGHDTHEALKLLWQFEELQEMHIQDRDRIRKELTENE